LGGWLREGFAKQLILDTQAGRQIDLLVESGVDRTFGVRDGHRRAPKTVAPSAA
jgi:hypothetical protein